MSKNVVMPLMGEGVDEGTIVRWMKAEGDTVRRDEPILEIETDKVTVEVNAEQEGVILKIYAQAGQVMRAGAVLAVIGEPGEAAPQTARASRAAARAVTTAEGARAAVTAAPEASAPPTVIEKATTRDVSGVRVTPVVARMVQEHRIDPRAVSGSGRDGRITKQDVLDYLQSVEHGETPGQPVAANGAPARDVNGDAGDDPADHVIAPAPQRKADPVLREPGDELATLSGMRRGIADHMVRSKHTSPHVTTLFEFDFSAVDKHRSAHKAEFARDGVKLTFLPYLALATVTALKKHRMANASWTDDGILLKRAINLGIAVAVPTGLLVPVVRGADALNLLGMARAINDLSDRARTNQLKPDEVRGGTFTITNHGTSGSLAGTPIINQPQVGILGIGVIEKRVKVINDAIAIRLCAYISFSFDHRILDGATADAFVMDIKQGVEHFSG